MEIKNITILGYSDAYITMIFDIFKNQKVKFKILDNLNLYNDFRIKNENITRLDIIK